MLNVLEREEELEVFLNSNQDKLVLVNFSTVWCPPCQLLKENIKKMIFEFQQSSELKKNLTVLEIDVDKFTSLAQNSQFNVYSIPSIFLFNQGKLVKKNVGVLNVAQLKEFINI